MRRSILMMLIAMAACASDNQTSPKPEENPHWPEILSTTEYIQRFECQKTDSILIKEGLDDEIIAKVRAFCAMSTDEILAELSLRFLNTSDSGTGFEKGEQPVYSCAGFYVNIPNYSDFGLSSSTCIWHDPNPVSCKIEGGVACLWGCNNIDPVLGWHTKWYASKSAVDADLSPKGYVFVSDYSNGSFRRSIGRGYTYQVFGDSIDANGQGIWHSEGPEPEPQFNWYAYFGGWWPFAVESWHDAC